MNQQQRPPRSAGFVPCWHVPSVGEVMQRQVNASSFLAKKPGDKKIQEGKNPFFLLPLILIPLHGLAEEPEEDTADPNENNHGPEPSHGPERPVFNKIITPGVPLALFKQPIQPAQAHGRIPGDGFSGVLQNRFPFKPALPSTGLLMRVFSKRFLKPVTGAHLVLLGIYLA